MATNNVYVASITNVLQQPWRFTEVDSSKQPEPLVHPEPELRATLTTTCVIVGGDDSGATEGFDTGNGTTWSPATVPGDFSALSFLQASPAPPVPCARGLRRRR